MEESAQLLTSRQVAERMGTTISTVNRWVTTGKLSEAQKIAGYNGARLFAIEDVDALLERKAS